MKGFLLGMATGLAALVLMGVAWDATFEGAPLGTSLASDLDTAIQDFKAETSDRASVEEHHGVGSNDNGLNRVGSARAFIQNAAPTTISPPGQYDSANTIHTAGTLTITEHNGADDIGRGRVWFDLDGADNTLATVEDNNALHVWDETGNAFIGATLLPGRTPFPPFYISGLEQSSTAVAFEVDIGVGRARAHLVPGTTDNVVNGNFDTAITKLVARSGANWVVGTGNDGVPLGIVLAGDLWLRTFMLVDPADGTTDVCFDTSAAAANCLADINVIAENLRRAREMGWVKVNAGNSDIDAFEFQPIDGSWLYQNSIQVSTSTVDQPALSLDPETPEGDIDVYMGLQVSTTGATSNIVAGVYQVGGGGDTTATATAGGENWAGSAINDTCCNDIGSGARWVRMSATRTVSKGVAKAGSGHALALDVLGFRFDRERR